MTKAILTCRPMTTLVRVSSRIDPRRTSKKLQKKHERITSISSKGAERDQEREKARSTTSVYSLSPNEDSLKDRQVGRRYDAAILGLFEFDESECSK